MPRPPRLAAPAAVSAALALALTGCAVGDDSAPAGSSAAGPASGGAATSDAAAPVVAVATTTQLGSVLDRVARCGGGAAVSVMGPGDDPHDFSASSEQVVQMVRSGLVFANGLGLEGGMESALANAGQDGAEVVEVAPELDPLPFGAGAHAEHGHEGETAEEHAAHAGEDAHAGHDHGSLDPHVWMDVARMADAAALMGTSLAEHTGEQRYAECGRTVQQELDATDAEVGRILAEVPEDRRTVVADHDAYGYFADAYGFEVSGVVIPGGSTDAEPSSQEIAALAGGMRRDGVDAVLTSVAAQNGLVDTVAREAGDVDVVELYESGVGPADSPEADYAQAMLYNARTLAEALAD